MDELNRALDIAMRGPQADRALAWAEIATRPTE